MNKSDVIKYVAECSEITKAQAQRSIDCYHKAIQGALKKGNKVTLVNFGTFRVTKRKARKARNPQTGELIQIKAKKVPTFTAGKGLKDAVD